MNSPYEGSSFFEFLVHFCKRTFAFLTWQLRLEDLASDEVQIFALICISISASLVGGFLVLRKKSMMAGSFSHTMLLGIVIAIFCAGIGGQRVFTLDISLPVLFLASLLTAFMTWAFTYFLHRYLRLQEDASLGIVFSFLFSLALAIITVKSRNLHIGVEIIFGNVDAICLHELGLAAFMALVSFIFVGCNFTALVFAGFDPEYAQVRKLWKLWQEALFIFLVSLTLLISFKALGLVIVLSLLIVPFLTARQLFSSLRLIFPFSIGIGVLCSILSVAISRAVLSKYDFALSTSGLFSLLLTAGFVIALCFRFQKKKPFIKQKHLLGKAGY